MTVPTLYSGTRASILAASETLVQNDVAVAHDTGEIWVADGVTALNARPRTLTTSGASTSGWVPVADGSGGYVWQAPAGGSGGSGPSTVSQDLGNSGTAVTLLAATTASAQRLTLNGSPTIQLPPLPGAGVYASIVLSLTQDATGGHSWGFVGEPVDYPSGIPTQVTTAHFENIVILECWDNAAWRIIPITSGPVPVSGLLFSVTDAAGDILGRYLGENQTPGVEPSVASGQTLGDFYTDHSVPTIWIYNNSSFVDIVGGGGTFSGVVVSGTPGPYQRPSYDTATSTWLAANPDLVDVAAHYNVRPSSSDVSSALATGIQDIVAAGLKPFLAPGMVSGTPTPYKLANPLVLGNGSASALSTWTAALEGMSVPTVTGTTSFYALPQTLVTRFIWTGASGYSGAMVQILGPVASVWLRNLLFDANGNTPNAGIQTVSVRSSHFENLAFLNAKGGAIHTTVGNSVAGLNTNDSRNTWRRISYGVLGHGSTLSGGILFTNGSLGTGGDSCYEEYDGVWIETSASGPPAGNMGVWFQACDSIRMRNVNIAAGGWQAATLFDYSASGGAHPSDCSIDNVEMGGQQFGAIQKGSPAGAGAARNRIERVGATNGQPPNPITQTGQPTGYGPVTNTTWNSPNLTGQVQLTAGVGTVSRSMIAWLNSGIGGTSFSDLPVNMRFSLAQAPGSGGAGEVWVDSVSGTTATIKSTNTSDNSLYNWELIGS